MPSFSLRVERLRLTVLSAFATLKWRRRKITGDCAATRFEVLPFQVLPRRLELLGINMPRGGYGPMLLTRWRPFQ